MGFSRREYWSGVPLPSPVDYILSEPSTVNWPSWVALYNKLWKILQEMGILDDLICLLRNLYAGQKATVRTEYGAMDWFQIGKKYIKAVYCHPSYLTYMQSTSWEIPGWMKHKLESRLLGEKSITSDRHVTPPLWQKVKRNWRAYWWKWKRRVKKLA